MKKMVNIILMIALLVSVCIPVFAIAESNDKVLSVSEERLLDYLQEGNEKLLVFYEVIIVI